MNRRITRLGQALFVCLCLQGAGASMPLPAEEPPGKDGAAGTPAAEPAQAEPAKAPPGEAKPGSGEGPDAQGKAAAPSRPAATLPELPEKELPPQTRPKPDPARDQFSRFSVHVKVTEVIGTSKGAPGPPAVPVVQNYLAEYFRRSGHPVTPAPTGAAYIIEGACEGQFHSTLDVLGKAIGWKYRGSGWIEVRDFTGKVIEKFEVPELFQESGKSEETAALDLERHMAKLLWDYVLHTSQVFANPEVKGLLGALASEGVTRAGAGSTDPADATDDRLLTAEDVVQRLAAIGFPAVPYLLQAFDDERRVLIPSEYPGLRGTDPGRQHDGLRVYHIADKALEEIFQKVSRMSLDIGSSTSDDARLRRVILAGWEREWKRFCKPYRESPSAKK